MLEAAADNAEDGDDIMEYLLSQPDGSTLITDEVVKAVARRGACRGMALLLKMAGDWITFMHDMAIEAAKNRAWGNEILHLIQAHGPGVEISFDIVNAALQFGSDLTAARLINLLENAGLSLPFEAAALCAARCEEGPESMSLLLTRFGTVIPMTPEVLQAATRNVTRDYDIADLLLKTRLEEVKLTGDLLSEAVLLNPETDTGVIKILVDRYLDNFQGIAESLQTAR